MQKTRRLWKAESTRIAFVTLLLGLVTSVCTVTIAFQRGRGRGSMDDRNGVPVWDVNPGFKHDVFTFARVQYSDGYEDGWGQGGWGQGGWGGGGRWSIDFPESDLNFSLRLQQLTSIQVNPKPAVVRLSDANLGDYPFLYLIEPGAMVLSEDEVKGLREYCMKGGFLMVDDFWGERQYLNLYQQLKRAFPDREPREVPLEHEIFQCVYPFKEKPQVPSVNWFNRGYNYEPSRSGDTSQVRYLAIHDDAERIMVFICHNTDLGDGWEREGENRDFFAECAVKKSYPMGINIVTYAMTH